MGSGPGAPVCWTGCRSGLAFVIVTVNWHAGSVWIISLSRLAEGKDDPSVSFFFDDEAEFSPLSRALLTVMQFVAIIFLAISFVILALFFEVEWDSVPDIDYSRPRWRRHKRTH